MLEAVILTAFSFFNTIRVVSYVPQITRIARDTNGATAVSYLTWSLWFCANGSTAAYAGVIIGDRALCLISSVNTLCCGIVIVLTMIKRRLWLRSRAASCWHPLGLSRPLRLMRYYRALPYRNPPPG